MTTSRRLAESMACGKGFEQQQQQRQTVQKSTVFFIYHQRNWDNLQTILGLRQKKMTGRLLDTGIP